MENRIKLMESLIDKLPVLTVIVNSEARVLNFNGSFSNDFFTVDPDIKDQLLGDVLSCVNSLGSTEGCGKFSKCRDCILRSSLNEVKNNGNLVFRKQGPFTFSTKMAQPHFSCRFLQQNWMDMMKILMLCSYQMIQISKK